ncbi:hypothetical protein SAMN05445060_0490 [Williamsia sterculiae]|uniref:Uncharacterized protein n=1 Tax=Williamsia sterculiae TaxID=1344003 RepID=A0A1N7D0P4_9NOCA|nr:hypothetical protein SAMN05445060_0490 [Williamsia sterculiae]
MPPGPGGSSGPSGAKLSVFHSSTVPCGTTERSSAGARKPSKISAPGVTPAQGARRYLRVNVARPGILGSGVTAPSS